MGGKFDHNTANEELVFGKGLMLHRLDILALSITVENKLGLTEGPKGAGA